VAPPRPAGCPRLPHLRPRPQTPPDLDEDDEEPLGPDAAAAARPWAAPPPAPAPNPAAAAAAAPPPGVLRPGIVHRLDKGTSGLMVVAKDDASHARLCDQFKARTVGLACAYVFVCVCLCVCCVSKCVRECACACVRVCVSVV
jgi:hypothetical protein